MTAGAWVWQGAGQIAVWRGRRGQWCGDARHLYRLKGEVHSQRFVELVHQRGRNASHP
jgi:hypothetical protein